MQFNKNNGDGENFEEAVQSALDKTKEQAVANTVVKVLGAGVGFLLGALFVPFVAVYAYNGMQPPVWPDISYLPAVAGFFVFRHLIHTLRSE